jgi:tetratricopeptide (TPR) repeat protein
LDPTSDCSHFWSEAVIAATEDPSIAAASMEEHATADNCSAGTAYLAASYCYNARQWKRTEHWARKAIELDPTYFRPYPFLAGACMEMGRMEEALTFAETARRISGPNPYSSGMLGMVLARSGRPSEARAVLEDPDAPRHDGSSGYASAMGKAVYSALGESAQAMDAIGQMIENRDPYAAWLHVFPFFQNLREHHRFQRLLASRGC